jgi:hypothetical protein
MDPKKPGSSTNHPEIDPDAPASAEEIAAAEALRDALADPRIDHEGAALARAAALAHAPRAIDPAEHRILVEKAILAAPAKKERAGGRVIRVAFGAAAAALSLAAAIALVVGTMNRADEVAMAPAIAPATPLAPSRSTQPLFQEPFARSGGASARIDRIARARQGDLRDNRFAMRGVR